MPQRHVGFLFVLLAALSWGGQGIFSKFLILDGIHPTETAFWRAAFGAMLFLPHALLRHGPRLCGVKDLPVFIGFGIVSVAGMFASYMFAVSHGGAALASVLIYTAPAWVAVLSRLIFKERMTFAKTAAVAASLAGAACISLSGGGTGGAVKPLGILFGLLAGLTYSFHYIFTKIYLQRHSATAIYAIILLVGAVTLFPFVDFAAKTPFNWLMLFSLGFFCSYVAYSFYCAGLKRLSPVYTAVTATFEPIFGVLLAWSIWGENFTPRGWAGAGLILGAVLIVVLEKKPTGPTLAKPAAERAAALSSEPAEKPAESASKRA